VWHYKCIRPILNGSTYPTLTCPNCRAAHDLEADIEEEEESYSEDETELQQAIEASKNPTIPTNSTNPTLPTNLTASAPPEQPRPSVDADGDSHMQDVMTDGASAPAPQRPPPPPPPAVPTQQPPPTVAIQVIQGIQFDTQPGATAPSNIASSLPRNIPTRAMANSRFDPHTRVNGTVNDVSLTPRNDAGPFVLDGSAGRSSSVNTPTTNGVDRPRSGSHVSLSHEERDRS
jgi:E3 ubiquitin-protein ligase DMA1/2